jgi:hypothetical protein
MDWKKVGVTVVIILLIGTVGVFLLFNQESTKESNKDISTSSRSVIDSKNSANFEEFKKVDYGERIVITAIYLNPTVESKNATFYIALDTHWGDLFEYDILNLSKIEVNGKVFTPVKWDESTQSWGHHRRGKLEFSSKALQEIENSNSFKLVITGIEKDRIFEWKL